MKRRDIFKGILTLLITKPFAMAMDAIAAHRPFRVPCKILFDCDGKPLTPDLVRTFMGKTEFFLWGHCFVGTRAFMSLDVMQQYECAGIAVRQIQWAHVVEGGTLPSPSRHNQTFAGIPLDIDLNMPPGEIHIKNPNGILIGKIINIGESVHG